jgi:recombination protein U
MLYPNNIKKTKKQVVNYANRGMNLESDLNISNKYYLENDIAVIYKKPTPIKIVKVSFDKQKNATIKEAFFQTPSTTDYNGIYEGQYIDFEAKEVNKDSFPLNNINSHQIKHIKSIIKHGGIAFLIVRFNKQNKTFVLKGETLIKFIDSNTRKSIPMTLFVEEGFLVKTSFIPRLDYLKIINEIYMRRL